MKKLTITTAALTTALLLGACGDKEQDTTKSSDNEKDINLVYVEWDTEVASTNVVGEVLKDMGYNVTLTPLDNGVMWESIAKGEADAMVAAWLPKMHAPKMEQYQDDVMELGPNLEGARVGLVVPKYMDVDSIADLTDEANKTITGIEPGANTMEITENLATDYPNLADWNVAASSSGAMTVALGQAYENNEDIVVVGWSPHWKFAKYDLKYLEDPKEAYGTIESIHTVTRLGLDKDKPEAFAMLDNFYWTSEDSEAVMQAIAEGTDPKDAAREWIDANKDTVEGWKK